MGWRGLRTRCRFDGLGPACPSSMVLLVFGKWFFVSQAQEAWVGHQRSGISGMVHRTELSCGRGMGSSSGGADGGREPVTSGGVYLPLCSSVLQCMQINILP